MTVTRQAKINDLTPVQTPIFDGTNYGALDPAALPTPQAGTLTLFSDSTDGNSLKVMDENRLITSLGGGGGGGLSPVFIDHTNIPSELLTDRQYFCDFSGAAISTTMTLASMITPGFDGDYVKASVQGTINGSTFDFIADPTYSVWYKDNGGNWDVAIYDSTLATVWGVGNTTTDPETFTDTNPTGITLTDACALTSELDSGVNRPDSASANVSYASSSSELLMVLPEGLGSETYKIGVIVTSIAEGMTVAFETSNSQTILLPNGSNTTTKIDEMPVATEFLFSWDQTKYNFSDDWSPLFADLSGSIGDLTVDTLTAETYENLPLATDTEAGTVPNYEKNLAYDFNVSGFSDISTVQGEYILNGDQVTINIPAFEGTSNANNINISLPSNLQRTTNSAWHIMMPVKDNGTVGVGPSMADVLSSGIIRYRKDLSAGFFTTSGIKGCSQGVTITYIKD